MHLPGRGRGPPPRAPGGGVAGPPGGAVLPGGRAVHHQGRCPRPRGNESRPGGSRRRGTVPRRPLVPAQRNPDPRAAPPRAFRRDSPAGRILHATVFDALRAVECHTPPRDLAPPPPTPLPWHIAQPRELDQPTH